MLPKNTCANTERILLFALWTLQLSPQLCVMMMFSEQEIQIDVTPVLAKKKENVDLHACT